MHNSLWIENWLSWLSKWEFGEKMRVNSINHKVIERIADSYDLNSLFRLLTFDDRLHFSQYATVSGLFWLARPTGVDANNNYNTATCHSFSQAWISPSDLSSLLSQEQSLSVIMCYSEWWIFSFYAYRWMCFLSSPTERTSLRDRTKQGL